VGIWRAVIFLLATAIMLNPECQNLDCSVKLSRKAYTSSDNLSILNILKIIPGKHLADTLNIFLHKRRTVCVKKCPGIFKQKMVNIFVTEKLNNCLLKHLKKFAINYVKKP
jgi:hypothetical protein